MKFIKLESRGGNYLVVASNVAWLRTAENGQTNVGIVGGQPLLVVGSVEEVAAKILAGLASGEEAAPVPAPLAAPAPAPVAQPAAQAPAPAPAPVPEPEPEPEPEPVQIVAPPEPAPSPEPEAKVEVAAEPDPEPAPTAPRPAAPAAPARPRPVSARSASMWERPAAAAPKSLKVKAGSQRMMGQLE